MISGWLYPPDSSARREAGLAVAGDRYTVTTGTAAPLTGSLLDLAISDRIGNIPRRFTLPDRSVFETTDNAAVDALLAATGNEDPLAGALYSLESRWQWIGLALLVTLLIGCVTVYWGMPWASRQIAFALPVRAAELISQQTLELLDESILAESALPQEEQERIRAHFADTLLPLQHEAFTYRLHFRKMSDIPNAFALPSGDIVVTDRLVQLADNQAEIDAVLLHEMGHVVHRHGLQQVLHSSFLTIAIVAISGDATATGNLAVALPVFLLQNHYSRDNETEADRYAFEHMIAASIDPANFSRIMAKIGSAADEDGGETGKATADAKNAAATVARYLSTHPPTPERIRMADAYSRQYQGRRAVPE
ncbi:MAG: M48 family metallopeptidase [Pseudomonadota bacterium]